MSAIVPHIEEDDDDRENVAPLVVCQAPLGELGAPRSCAPDIQQTHAGLTRTLWIRRSIEDLLQGRKYYIADGRSLGIEGAAQGATRLFFVLDPPFLKHEIPWMPAATEELRVMGLVGSNGKMACPTWDLPAGSPELGGSCPGATQGQSTVPLQIRSRRAAAADMKDVDVANTICALCVSGETLILVRDRGWVPIDSMLGIDSFEVWSGEAWRATRVIAKGIAPVVEVRSTWGARIKVTADHKILARHGGMTPAEELNPGRTLVAQPPPVPVRSAYAALPLRERSAPYRTAVTENFPMTWSYDVGLFLGYIQGDGCISGGKYQSITIAMADHDRADVERLRDLAASWCGTIAECRTKTIPPSKFCADPRPQAFISWHVKSLVEFLADLGLAREPSAESRRAPHAIWTASQEGVRGYLSGLFSTDGSVTVNGDGKIEVSMASVSEGLLRDVQLLLFELGITSSICPYRTSNAKRVADGYRALYKLGINSIYSIKRFATCVGFANERKTAKLSGLLADDQRKGKPRSPKVASVTPLPVHEPVYDLVNVGEEHQFVANGFSVSNCYASGGNYLSPHVQVGEILRYWWSRDMMETPAGREEWVSTVVRAFEGETWDEERLTDPHTGKKILPVRVHSSGDFFSASYLESWFEVARRLPELSFWAPTRTWAAAGWTKRWEALMHRGAIPANFSIRPSAYHTGDNAPGPGQKNPWPGSYYPFSAAGTTALYKPGVGTGRDDEGSARPRE